MHFQTFPNEKSRGSCSQNRSLSHNQQQFVSLFGSVPAEPQARDQLSQSDRQCGQNMIPSMSTAHIAMMNYPRPLANGAANNASLDDTRSRVTQINKRML